MSWIKVTNLEKSYGKERVLRGLDLSVDAGTVYGLLGRNGAGKTTLLKILIGLSLPDQGSAHVFGKSLGEGCPPEKTDVAYVGQGEFLPFWARVRDLIALEAGLRPNWDPTSLEGWLAQENLKPKRKISELSVGLRKRLEVELALAGRPKVLLLDEPFAGLDPVSRAQVMTALMDRTASTQVAAIVSSHIISDLERVCNRVGVLADGVIAFEDDVEAIRERGSDLESLGLKIMTRSQEGAAQ